MYNFREEGGKRGGVNFHKRDIESRKACAGCGFPHSRQPIFVKEDGLPGVNHGIGSVFELDPLQKDGGVDVLRHRDRVSYKPEEVIK